MTTTPTSQIVLLWQTLERYPYKRSTKWYAVGGVFILMFAAYGLFDGSWLTALLALLLGGTYFLLRNVHPKKITIRLTAIGIEIEDRTHLWSDFKEFWILLGKDFTELHFASQSAFRGEVVVLIRDPETPVTESPDPGIVRQILLSYLPERAGMQERFLDTVARLLRL
ncbi:MAG TPA: hypothetical protein VJB60_04995 [Candidatus Peribacterales bacterium]|nr:hypothetical protein [Candidatus Peribacterales bacterium]